MVYTQDELKRIIRMLLQKYHAESALLFGSYTRQEADATSDIDLLVIGGKDFDPTDVFCIADELHSITQKAVDVYELCEIDPDTAFYRTIMDERVRIA